jgi:hypothetical protein
VGISVDSSGRPFRVVDVDRIAVNRKGDYSFVITAPVEDVRAAAESGSEPGLRSGAVIWQGFSPGRRLLAAAITLRAAAAVSNLPLRIEANGSELRLVNATSGNVATVDAKVPALSLARALDTTRASLKAGVQPTAPLVETVGPVRDARLVGRAPLRVRGTVRFASGPPRRVAGVIEDEPLRIAGAGPLKALTLSVSVPEPASFLRPPGARSWLDLARSGRFAGGRGATRLAVTRLIAAGLALQFQQFLANPDAGGRTRTTYSYELAARPHAVAAAPPRSGNGWVVPLAVALGLAAAVVGGAVLWAHS